MSDVAEAFFETAMEKGVYRNLNPKIVAAGILGNVCSRGLQSKYDYEPECLCAANAGNG